MTKKWHHSNSLHVFAWTVVPIALLCIAVIVVMYNKRKHNTESVNQADIGLTHVYANAHHHESKSKREVITTNDSFYNLLQAVN
ncbi:hypothetical protein WMY93_026272 [Mugilogobius chulae]|uniref:Uncharacterized protein n=1 Tax=Mugilogobius chulae TaxID=88201 RepID=A0AAW0MX34_9GOBI